LYLKIYLKKTVSNNFVIPLFVPTTFVITNIWLLSVSFTTIFQTILAQVAFVLMSVDLPIFVIITLVLKMFVEAFV
jgi:hypothetical protein